MGYQFYFYHDVLERNLSAQLDERVRHRQLIVVHGLIHVNLQTIGVEHGVYCSGGGEIAAGPEGAWVWRCEIVADGAAESLLGGEAVFSQVRMKKAIRSVDPRPGEKWLFRSDTITMFPGAVIPRHVHDGPGVRCLKFGEFRIESKETTATYRPGEPWYESGPDDPVIARASATQPAGFVRLMLLPPQWIGRNSVKFVDADSGTVVPEKGSLRSGRRVYNDTIIEI
jgi:hypothetical protein